MQLKKGCLAPKTFFKVIHAEAGIQKMVHCPWSPASAGMTRRTKIFVKCRIIGQLRNISSNLLPEQGQAASFDVLKFGFWSLFVIWGSSFEI